MSENHRDPDNERKVALITLKLGGAAITASALALAAGWAGRRLKFEHTAQKFTHNLEYLESEDAEHHHAIVRRVAAASLVRPIGLTKDQLKSLATQNKQSGLIGEALYNLCTKGILESSADGRQRMFRPTQDFMKMLVDKGQIETPKLLSEARGIYGEFSYDRLYAFIEEPDIVDMTPLSVDSE